MLKLCFETLTYCDIPGYSLSKPPWNGTEAKWTLSLRRGSGSWGIFFLLLSFLSQLQNLFFRVFCSVFKQIRSVASVAAYLLHTMQFVKFSFTSVKSTPKQRSSFFQPSHVGLNQRSVRETWILFEWRSAHSTTTQVGRSRHALISSQMLSITHFYSPMT